MYFVIAGNLHEKAAGYPYLRDRGKAPHIRTSCEANTWTIVALDIQADHVHLFLSAPPNVSPSQITHTLRGTTARKVFQRFLEVKKYLWAGARHGLVRTAWAVWEI